MKKAPNKERIGITLRMVESRGYYEPRDAISHDWISFLEKIGYLPVMISNCHRDPVDYFTAQKCQALILTNGEDVELDMRDSKNFRGTKRDITEAKLISHAIKKNLPVIGVCRGMQFINVYFRGGSAQRVKKHVTKKHKLKIVDKRIRDIFKAEALNTNSYHNLGILSKDLSHDLKCWAMKHDLVEGLYHRAYKIFAIQWHPERKNPSKKFDEKLFKNILNGNLFSEMKRKK